MTTGTIGCSLPFAGHLRDAVDGGLAVRDLADERVVGRQARVAGGHDEELAARRARRLALGLGHRDRVLRVLQVGGRLLADRVAGTAEAVGERVAGLDDERAARGVARDAVEREAVVEAALDERRERRRRCSARRSTSSVIVNDAAVRLHLDVRGPRRGGRSAASGASRRRAVPGSWTRVQPAGSFAPAVTPPPAGRGRGGLEALPPPPLPPPQPAASDAERGADEEHEDRSGHARQDNAALADARRLRPVPLRPRPARPRRLRLGRRRADAGAREAVAALREARQGHRVRHERRPPRRRRRTSASCGASASRRRARRSSRSAARCSTSWPSPITGRRTSSARPPSTATSSTPACGSSTAPTSRPARTSWSSPRTTTSTTASCAARSRPSCAARSSCAPAATRRSRCPTAPGRARGPVVAAIEAGDGRDGGEHRQARAAAVPDRARPPRPGPRARRRRPPRRRRRAARAPPASTARSSSPGATSDAEARAADPPPTHVAASLAELVLGA